MAEDDPLRLFQLFSESSIPVVVIGGHAVNVHGYIRSTEDMDLVFLRTQDSEAKLLALLNSIEARWISNEIDPTTGIERLIPVSLSYLRANHLMMLTTSAGFLDLYDYVPGFPEISVEDLFVDSVEVENLRFVSLSWLRKLKAKAGRHKDLDDLEHLPVDQ